MKRNVDKIKDLEKELGRYRKKVADQKKTIIALNEQMDNARGCLAELSMDVDAILASTAILYGNEIPDGDTGEALGYRLIFPRFSPRDILSRYDVKTSTDKETGTYITEVTERKPAESEEDKDHGGA